MSLAFRTALLAAASALCCMAVEPLSWDDALAHWRAGDAAPVTALYVGGHDATFVRMLAAGQLDTAGIPVVVLAAGDEATNPLTGRPLLGAELIKLWSSLIQGPSAGTIYFLDGNGLPIPMLTLPHALHRNRANVITLYCRYVHEGMQDKMSIADFGQVIGFGPTVLDLSREISSHAIERLEFAIHRLNRDSRTITAARLDGSPVNPALDGGTFYVVTADPDAPIFLAQMRELWLKLSLRMTNGALKRPPIVVIGPVTSVKDDYRQLIREGIEFDLAVASRQDLFAAPTPRLIMSGGGDGGAETVEVTGFIPGPEIGTLVHVPVADRRPLHPDIPLGEVDWIRPGPLADAAAR